MRPLRVRVIGGAGLLLLLIVGGLASAIWPGLRIGAANDPQPGFPRVVLWAWERAESLDFLDPATSAVAVLVKTVAVRDSRLTVHPRLQPVRLAPGTSILAVVRIETDPPLIAPADSLLNEIVREITEVGRNRCYGVQIDFDARASEREFYRVLLQQVRRQLPEGMKLSITALASWCAWDNWIRDLPIDEAVPMLFRLGKGEKEIGQFLKSENGFRSKLCRCSVGLSMDERQTPVPFANRIYFFNPHPWTKDTVLEALREARDLQ